MVFDTWWIWIRGKHERYMLFMFVGDACEWLLGVVDLMVAGISGVCRAAVECERKDGKRERSVVMPSHGFQRAAWTVW